MITDRGRKAQPNVGVVQVPDERVDFLASVFEPKKTTYATIEFVDVQGLVRGKGRDMALDPVRDVDTMVHVVRAFEDDTVPHPEGSVDVDPIGESPPRNCRPLDVRRRPRSYQRGALQTAL